MSKHILSENILPNERQHCIDKLRERNTILSMGVIKFYKTNAPQHNEWEEMGAGVLMFIKDSQLRSFFIKFISFTMEGIDYEQKVLKKMQLLQSAERFLSVEGEDCILGMMFSFKNEYDEFYGHMSKHTKKKAQATVEPAEKTPKPAAKSQNFFGNLMGRNKKKSGASVPLVIGAPTDFRQIAHVGSEGLTVFGEQKDSEKWEQLAAILLGADADERTNKQLVDYVNKNGGIDKFIKAAEKKSLKDKKPPSPPSNKPTSSASVAPPCAPPPPGAPPPCAPPPSGPPAPCAPPPSGPPAPSVSPPKTNTSSGAPPPPSKPQSGRGDLLSQIQQGKALKKVEIVEDESDEEAEGILGALAQNLANFRQRMNIGEDSQEEEDDEEWSD